MHNDEVLFPDFCMEILIRKVFLSSYTIYQNLGWERKNAQESLDVLVLKKQNQKIKQQTTKTKISPRGGRDAKLSASCLRLGSAPVCGAGTGGLCLPPAPAARPATISTPLVQSHWGLLAPGAAPGQSRTALSRPTPELVLAAWTWGRSEALV